MLLFILFPWITIPTNDFKDAGSNSFWLFFESVHQIHYNPLQKCHEAKSLQLQTIQKLHHQSSFHSKTLRQSQHFNRKLDEKTFCLCALLSSLCVLIVCFPTWLCVLSYVILCNLFHILCKLTKNLPVKFVHQYHHMSLLPPFGRTL